MTKVVNIRTSKYDVYIGRRKNEKFHYGNPFSHNPKWGIVKSNRHEAVAAFKSWLAGTTHQDVEPDRRRWILNNIHKLKDKKLGCFCAPKECHGEALIELINFKG